MKKNYATDAEAPCEKSYCNFDSTWLILNHEWERQKPVTFDENVGSDSSPRHYLVRTYQSKISVIPKTGISPIRRAVDLMRIKINDMLL